LRGRSGRQGDPGSSQFFLSLEDDLLRIFGGEKIKSLMEKFNLSDDQPIESSLVSRAVNEAQSKIEGLNFDLRKYLLEYDDVLNKQRNALYKKRQEVLLAPIDENEEKDEHGHTKSEHFKISSLGALDIMWMNHLENLEALRESVGMRAYGQKEPLIEYRRESYTMFKDMMVNFDSWLHQAQIDSDQTQINSDNIRVNQSRNQNKSESPYKAGRNEPCPCGSGKKYKKCCGK